MAATRVWPENDAAADRPQSVRRAGKKPEKDVASGFAGEGVVEEADLGARVEDPTVDFPNAGEPASLTVPEFPTNALVVATAAAATGEHWHEAYVAQVRKNISLIARRDARCYACSSERDEGSLAVAGIARNGTRSLSF